MRPAESGTCTCEVRVVCHSGPLKSNPPGPCGLSYLGNLSSLSSFGRRGLPLSKSLSSASKLTTLTVLLAVAPSKNIQKPLDSQQNHPNTQSGKIIDSLDCLNCCLIVFWVVLLSNQLFLKFLSGATARRTVKVVSLEALQDRCCTFFSFL